MLASMWIAADGKSFWLVWTDFQFVGAQRPYYAFNSQKAEGGIGDRVGVTVEKE